MISIIQTIISIVGIVGFFIDVKFLLYIGGLAYILETFREIANGSLTSGLNTTIMTVIVAGIISAIFKYNILAGIAFGLCIESTIMSVASAIMFFKH